MQERNITYGNEIGIVMAPESFCTYDTLPYSKDNDQMDISLTMCLNILLHWTHFNTLDVKHKYASIW